MNLYDDQDKFWSKQKQKIKTKESKILNQCLGYENLLLYKSRVSKSIVEGCFAFEDVNIF